MTSAFKNSPASLIAARLTPRGRGAVATLRLTGDLAALERGQTFPLRAVNDRSLSEQSLGRVAFGHWGTEHQEEVVFCRIDSETLEIHCHGGDAAVRRILDDLATRGIAIVPWQTLLEKRAGIFIRECDEALAQASTFRTAAILLEQRSGTLSRTLASLQEGISNATTGSNGATGLDPERLKELLGWAEFGRHLTVPWEVVLIGRPNVGKSSLTNALLGFARSIVFDRPGTTRDVVTAETAFEGWPVRFADTAGLRDDTEALEAEGIARTRELLREADCRLLLLDLGQSPQATDRELIASHPDALIVAHKCDLPDRWGTELPATAIRVSSRTGEGVDELAAKLVRTLVPRVPPSGTEIPFTQRQIDLLRTALAEWG